MHIYICYTIILPEQYYLEGMETAEAPSYIGEKILSKLHGPVKSCMRNQRCMDWWRQGVLTQRCGRGLEKYYTLLKEKQKFAKAIKN
jgi:hypothetical protein